MIKLGTIRLRLTLWYVFLLALTVLAFSFYLELELQTHLSAQIDAGLQVSASQILLDMDDSVNPPVLRPMSQNAVANLTQSSFAVRLVSSTGEVLSEIGGFPNFDPSLDTPGFVGTTIDGVPWRIYTEQVETEVGRFDAYVQIAQSLNLVDATRNSLLNLIALGLPLILIAAAAGGLFIANRALRPVATITSTVQAINATDLSQRIVYDGASDELSRLTETLNSMLDRLQAGFETERRFTADASHELRTPLTAIKGQIGVTLTRPRTAEEYQDTLRQLQRETDRLVRLSNDLLFLARLDAAPLSWMPEQINLSDLLGAVIDQSRIVAEQKSITVNTQMPASLPINGVADHLIRLFLNVLDNAVKYTPAGGQVTVTAITSRNEVIVTIQDSGPGIAPDHLPHLFERFYRVERGRGSDTGGSGLGLAIAYQIARAHSGSIRVESKPGAGSSFIITLPLAPEP